MLSKVFHKPVVSIVFYRVSLNKNKRAKAMCIVERSMVKCLGNPGLKFKSSKGAMLAKHQEDSWWEDYNKKMFPKLFH